MLSARLTTQGAPEVTNKFERDNICQSAVLNFQTESAKPQEAVQQCEPITVARVIAECVKGPNLFSR